MTPAAPLSDDDARQLVELVAALLGAGATEVEVDRTRHGTLKIRAARGAPAAPPATAWRARP